MTSHRQIEANRRNAKLSTGPVTMEGKQRSRRNAIRHGLTAETVIAQLEDAEDYAAFEIAVTADFDATSVVERELVLRLASLLWRLRRATAIESGLFRNQAEHFLKFKQKSQPGRERIIDDLYNSAIGDVGAADRAGSDQGTSSSQADNLNDFDELTQSYIKISNLPACPLDRLSRYEATLWRQACQILFTLQFMSRRRPWTRGRLP